MSKYYETYEKKWFFKDSKLCYMQDEMTFEAKNSEQLDLLDPSDMCIGVIGDGCGGGRIFIADTGHKMIKVYEPENAEVFVILKDINSPQTIAKKACILSITTDVQNELIEFDLSSMTHTTKSL